MPIRQTLFMAKKVGLKEKELSCTAPATPGLPEWHRAEELEEGTFAKAGTD